jgi:hypothetical protein
MPQVLEQKRNISGIGIGRFPGERAFLQPIALSPTRRIGFKLSNFREYLKTEIFKNSRQFRDRVKTEGKRL